MNEKQPTLFEQLKKRVTTSIDASIAKAESVIKTNKEVKSPKDEELFHAKTLTADPSYAIHSQGWKDKPHRLQNSHLKQMSLKSSIIVAIIQARQNQVSNYSALDTTGYKRGWCIRIKEEKRLLQEYKAKLQSKVGKSTLSISKGTGEEDSVDDTDWKLERAAKKQLHADFCEARSKIESYIQNGGELEGRPFDAKKWTFDRILRVWVRDSLTYDLYASEIVPNAAGDPHYFFPVDASTIKFASPNLKHVPAGTAMSMIELDILYPEKEAKQIREKRVTELDPKKLENDEYRYVQVVRGRVERGYTEEELKIGIRNPTTDIYNNGYGMSELELIVSLVTGHLNSEFYNQSYFTQGFSAKGILHIKANINRRKLETIRQQWQHMLRGSRNSFQTPIFAGVEGVEWIKLDQSHNDIGFEHWLRYLTKMICSVYQIDPSELGIGFKEEGGGSGGGLSGDNTKEKLQNSKERGLFPLLRHLQEYINCNIVAPVDDRFCFEFTGVTNESDLDRVNRLEKEAMFAKTVNEVREELDLPPLPFGDKIILNKDWLAWYAAHIGLNLNPQAPEDEKEDKAKEKAKVSTKPKA